MKTHLEQVAGGERFEFGNNWASFLSTLDDARIKQAEISLKSLLGMDDLTGRTFLDIGSGSGLFSLAAKRLGAIVHSFDFDPQSMACTRELKRRYFPEDPSWKIEEASALDEAFMSALGKFDIVYSWGVLHHTGNLARAVELSSERVDAGGNLFVAIYNDQGEAAGDGSRSKNFTIDCPAFFSFCWF